MSVNLAMSTRGGLPPPCLLGIGINRLGVRVTTLFQLAVIRSLLAVALLGSAPVLAEPDVLVRPALQTARANSSAMLAVTRAGNRIVAVGERGIVILSDDNGITWRQSVVPVSETLTNVQFANDRTGWAVGHSGIVLRSSDGGQTWQGQLDGKKAAELSLALAKQRAALAAGDTKGKQQLKRNQNLVIEAERLVADGPDKPFLDLSFRNEAEGFIVGAYGLILGTTDGGQTWTSWQDRLDNGRGRHLYSIAAAGKDIYIAGEQGTLFHSTDAGLSFSEVKTPYAGSYFGVRQLAGGGVLVFGLRGNVYQSHDGVHDWQKVPIGDDAALNASCLLSDGSLILVDQGGRVLRSKDGGHSFQLEPQRQGFPLSGVVQAADSSIVLVGLGGVAKISPLAAVPGAGQ